MPKGDSQQSQSSSGQGNSQQSQSSYRLMVSTNNINLINSWNSPENSD